MLIVLLAYLLALGAADFRDVKDKQDRHPRSSWRLFLDLKGSRMVLTTEENGMIQDCYVSGDNYLIKSAIEKIPRQNITRLDYKTISSLTKYCSYGKWTRKISGSSGREVVQQFGVFSGLFIYPGTKWCGAGNVSESYDDLGPEFEADMCCREHDYCNDSIEGYGSKYGLDNNAPYTKSHCTCDNTFYNCLREADTKASNRLGKIFFNYLQAQCFKLEYPIIGCVRYKGWFRRRCQEYELDEEQEREWQMFDAKHFVPKSDEEKRFAGQQDAFDYILGSSFDMRARNIDIENKGLQYR